MKTLSVGIGCRAHSPAAQIEAAVREALGSLAFAQIRTVASIDTKADEPGLLEFCARHGLPLALFSRAQIAAIQLDRPSEATQEHLGVDGVCEPCALLAAQAGADGTARVMVRKTIHAGVTVAIATSNSGDAPVPDHTPIRPIQQDLP